MYQTLYEFKEHVFDELPVIYDNNPFRRNYSENYSSGKFLNFKEYYVKHVLNKVKNNDSPKTFNSKPLPLSTNRVESVQKKIPSSNNTIRGFGFLQAATNYSEQRNSNTSNQKPSILQNLSTLNQTSNTSQNLEKEPALKAALDQARDKFKQRTERLIDKQNDAFCSYMAASQVHAEALKSPEQYCTDPSQYQDLFASTMNEANRYKEQAEHYSNLLSQQRANYKKEVDLIKKNY